MTLRALFAEWPRERLSQIYSERREPDRSAAAYYFLLNEGEPRVRSIAARQLVRLVRFIAGHGETALFFFHRISPRLRHWVDGAAPQVIFTQLGGLPMGLISLEIARRRRIPFVVHVSDDWVQNWPESVIGRSIFPLTHLANRGMKNVLRRSMRDAAAVTVISEEMADEYERRYGRRGHVLHNGVDLTEWPSREPRDARTPARLLYSGSVFTYAQHTSLEDLRDAVRDLRAAGHALELVIRTQHRDVALVKGAFGNISGTRLDDPVPREALARELAAADVLLVPVNFDAVTVDFIRLSLPGKLAEYLASGTPVLYYGPPDVAQAKLLEREQCALLVTARDPERLTSAIVRIVRDTDLRRTLSMNARRVAERQFDIRDLRGRLHAAIDDALAPAVRRV